MKEHNDTPARRVSLALGRFIFSLLACLAMFLFQLIVLFGSTVLEDIYLVVAVLGGMLVWWWQESSWREIADAIFHTATDVHIWFYKTMFYELEFRVYSILDGFRTIKSQGFLSLVQKIRGGFVNCEKHAKDLRATWSGLEDIRTSNVNNFLSLVSSIPGAHPTSSKNIHNTLVATSPLVNATSPALRITSSAAHLTTPNQSQTPPATSPRPTEEPANETPNNNASLPPTTPDIPSPTHSTIITQTPTPSPPKVKRTKLGRRVKPPLFICPPDKLPQFFDPQTGEYGDDQNTKVPVCAIYALVCFMVLVPVVQFVFGPGFAERVDGKKDRSLGGAVMKMGRKVKGVGERWKKVEEEEEKEGDLGEEGGEVEVVVGCIVEGEVAEEDKEDEEKEEEEEQVAEEKRKVGDGDREKAGENEVVAACIVGGGQEQQQEAEVLIVPVLIGEHAPEEEKNKKKKVVTRWVGKMLGRREGRA